MREDKVPLLDAHDTDSGGDSEPGPAWPASHPAGRSYTREDVALHASIEDCWVVIHGDVYDVTPAMSRRRIAPPRRRPHTDPPISPPAVGRR